MCESGFWLILDPTWSGPAQTLTHPLVVADGEFHCELRLGLKEKGGVGKTGLERQIEPCMELGTLHHCALGAGTGHPKGFL